jgi:thioredoxin reductase
VTLGDLKDRRDIPAVTEKLEAANIPGLFLAGELTGYALIRAAISHGTAIANEVARRIADRRGRGLGQAFGPPENGMFQTHPTPGEPDADVLDLCIVGAGPAGLAASLAAKGNGLSFVTLEQGTVGGTVSKYPRRKLVMTQPVDLPLYGRLKRLSYTKEELIELWSELAERYELPIRTAEEFIGLERTNGCFVVRTKSNHFRARFVCLALGRRGTPAKLGVPGEELSKVAYSLIDAQSYQHRKVVVVGGGDSAIEAALGLAEQPGNQVTLSYRNAAFFRLKARNDARLKHAIAEGRVECIYESHVREITPSSVHIEIRRTDAPPAERVLPNDDVFVMAGGVPPFKLLERAGVSFDPADGRAAPPLAELGTGLFRALVAALGIAVLALAWAVVFRDYYRLAATERPLHEWHKLLRPSSTVGVSCGVAGVLCILANLSYLLRRAFSDWIPWSLQSWMTWHAVTGFLALVLAIIHSGLAPKNTVGGHAFAALVFLLVTGAIGRYFYSFVPRAANGQELALEELNSQIAVESTSWDRFGRGFGDKARAQVQSLVDVGKWRGNFLTRLVALLRTQSRARETMRELQVEGRREGLSDDQLDNLQALARRAYRTALVSAHYEDLRSLLESWRYFHRWVALLMVLLSAVHIGTAVRYGGWPRCGQ